MTYTRHVDKNSRCGSHMSFNRVGWLARGLRCTHIGSVCLSTPDLPPGWKTPGSPPSRIFAHFSQMEDPPQVEDSKTKEWKEWKTRNHRNLALVHTIDKCIVPAASPSALHYPPPPPHGSIPHGALNTGFVFASLPNGRPPRMEDHPGWQTPIFKKNVGPSIWEWGVVGNGTTACMFSSNSQFVFL